MKQFVLLISIMAVFSCQKESICENQTLKYPSAFYTIKFGENTRDSNGIRWNVVELEVTIDCNRDPFDHCAKGKDELNTEKTFWIIMNQDAEYVDTIQWEDRYGLICE